MKTSKFQNFLVHHFVSLSLPPQSTHQDFVEKVARAAHIPIESLPQDLQGTTFPRGQVACAFAGDLFDQIARDFDQMQWWISDRGLNMAIVRPATPAPFPGLTELLGELEGTELERQSGATDGKQGAVTTGRRATKKAPKRSSRYVAIDKVLQQIAESRPQSQKTILQSLDQRKVPLPDAEPFKTAGGWIAGFRLDEKTARAWLAKRWAQLERPWVLPKGPKKKLQ